MHSYFSPYGTPYDAAVAYFSVLADLHYRLKKNLKMADEQFRFAKGIDEFTGEVAWSLVGLKKALENVDTDCLEYHNQKGDLAEWARTSLGAEGLGRELDELKDIKGERLRKALLQAVDAALKLGR